MQMSGRASVLAGVLSVAVASGLVGGVGGMAGCTGYSNMNTTAGMGSVTNPNARTPSEVVREAVRYVVGRYPAGGRFAVNLVEGTRPNMADFIMRELPAGAEMTTAANTDLPTYYVGAVRVRGGTARVDVIRPVVELGEQPGGGYATQAVTVHLEGGTNPWRVERIQRWALGAVELPERFYVDGENAEQGVAIEETPAEVVEETASVSEGDGVVEVQP